MLVILSKLIIFISQGGLTLFDPGLVNPNNKFYFQTSLLKRERLKDTKMKKTLDQSSCGIDVHAYASSRSLSLFEGLHITTMK